MLVLRISSPFNMGLKLKGLGRVFEAVRGWGELRLGRQQVGTNRLCCSEGWKIRHGRHEVTSSKVPQVQYVVIPRRSMTAVVLEDQQRQPERVKTPAARWFEKGRASRDRHREAPSLWAGLGGQPSSFAGPRTRRSRYGFRLVLEAKRKLGDCTRGSGPADARKTAS